MRTFVAPSGAEKGGAPRAAHGRGKRALCLVLCAAAVFAAAGIAGCAPERARSRYAMTLEYFPETRTLAGEMTADVVNTSQTAWEEIAFRLRANAWREEPPVSALYAPAVFYGEERKGAIEVLSVSGGEPSLSEDGTLLRVALPEPLYPEERAAVGMRFTLTLPEANFRFGAGESVVALTDFYPVLSACAQEEASPYADAAVNGFADYDVTLTLPETYLVACTGTVADAGEETGSLIRNVSDLIYTYDNLGVVGVTLICGKTSGSGYAIFASKSACDYVVAWEKASVSPMESKSAAYMLYGKEIAKAKNKSAAERKFAKVYADENTAMDAAEDGCVDMVIYPAHTRQYLIATVRSMVKR